MRRPDFWRDGGILSHVLTPLGWAYHCAGRIRRLTTQPYNAPIPIICVGNLVVGGAGKTPVAMALAEMLIATGLKPHFLTRGYGGNLGGPVQVDPSRHKVDAVGDEALLLAAIAPCWVARNRAGGARAAVESGADVIVMDDGFQNPQLAKDLSLIVIDGAVGFGNGRIIPAGPLRENPAAGIARADAAIVIGMDIAGVEDALAGRLPALNARFTPSPDTPSLAGRAVVAFAGIGRPEKFFASLRDAGCDLKAVHHFPDHHIFAPDEIDTILEQATALGATAMTTAKDAVRLPMDAHNMIEVFHVVLEWDAPDHINDLINRAVSEHGNA